MSGWDATQVAAIVLLAAALAVATLLSSIAAGGWQDVLRLQVANDAALVEDVRQVYTSEAVFAWEIVTAETRESEYETVRSVPGVDTSTVSAEIEAVQQAAFAYRRKARRAPDDADRLIAGDRYRRDDTWYDVIARLGDARRQDPATDGTDLDAGQTTADQTGRASLTVIGMTLPLAGVGVIATWAARRQVRRRAGRTDAEAADTVLPAPWGEQRERQRAIALALLAWAVTALLAIPQVAFANSEQRAQAVAARQAVQVSTGVAASNVWAAYREQVNRGITTLEIEGLSRQYVAVGFDDPRAVRTQHLLAAADQRAARTLRGLAERMGRLPTSGDPVDAGTLRAMASTWQDHVAGTDQVARATAAAARSSRRSTFTTGGVFLAALACAVAELAHVRADPRRARRLTGASAAALAATAVMFVAALV